MRFVISVSITDRDIQEAINKYRQQGGNLSGLIQNLLKNYFFGDENGDRAMYKLSELEGKANELKKTLDTLFNEIQSFKQTIEEEKKKDDETSKDLIEQIKNNEYYDISELLHSHSQDDIRAIKVRISVFAKNNKIPLQKAEELFKQVYPELKKYI